MQSDNLKCSNVICLISNWRSLNRAPAKYSEMASLEEKEFKSHKKKEVMKGEKYTETAV